MRFRLEAKPGELAQKRDALVKALVDEFGRLDPDLAESLEKALPPKESELKFRVLQELRSQFLEEYERQTKLMLAEIGKVLDRTMTGAAGGALSKAFGIGPPPKDPEDYEEEGEEEEPLEPGDYDPKTDTIVPEPEEEEEEEEEEKSMGFSSFDKAEVPQSDPLDYDYTKPVADRDEKGYQRIKAVLKRRGYKDADFELGGQLYGFSTNQLLDMVREQKAS
jgi:hypothetical protein